MTSVLPGDLIELDVTSIAHGGVAVARHEGRVVFVADAIPGERVRARVTESSKASFWRADTVEVLDGSADRRAHIWPEASVERAPGERAGGAEFGHILEQRQRALKREVLADALERFGGGGVDAPVVESLEEDGTGWRTRLTVHVDGEGRSGPFAARSHTIVPVSAFPLARHALSAAAVGLRDVPRGRVELVETADGEVVVVPVPDAPRTPRHGRRRPPRSCPRVVTERAAGRSFSLDATGFWQVHHRAADALDGAVAELLDGRIDPAATHLDLYGGVGLFSATLARLGARDITTVEASAQATAHASDNLADLGVRAVTARVDRFLSSFADDRSSRGEELGAVVLDPPRAGAGRDVVDRVAALDPGTVVYVACDPVAFSRDLGLFRGHGYEPADMRAFDLFPQTHHFETVALLTR